MSWLACTPFVWAQLRFDSTVLELGSIEPGASIEGKFHYKNVGAQSVEVKSVKSACACLQPKWNQIEIAPGESGDLEMLFQAKETGPFNQTAAVHVSGVNQPIPLVVRGNVKNAKKDGGDDKAQAIVYKDTLGDLAFEKVTEQTGLLKSDQNKDFVFHIKNVSKHTLKFEDKVEDKPYFSIVFKDKELKKGAESTITVKYTGEKAKGVLKNNASFTESLAFFTSEKTSNKKLLNLTGTYQRVYSPEEIANGPKISFEKTEFEAGEIIQGEHLTYAFKFTNNGKTDLNIESAKASCGCTATAPKEKVVKPGQSSQIDVNFDSHGKQGAQHKTVTVTSNDPEKPTVVLHIKCTIKTDPFSSGGSAPINNQGGDGGEGLGH